MWKAGGSSGVRFFFFSCDPFVWKSKKEGGWWRKTDEEGTSLKPTGSTTRNVECFTGIAGSSHDEWALLLAWVFLVVSTALTSFEYSAWVGWVGRRQLTLLYFFDRPLVGFLLHRAGHLVYRCFGDRVRKGGGGEGNALWGQHHLKLGEVFRSM